MTIARLPSLGGIEGLSTDPATSYTLPARSYFDPAVYARENDKVFARSWCYAGHLGALKEAGDYITCRIADENIFVIRGKDGQLRGFYNVCQHRAHELVQGSGWPRCSPAPTTPGPIAPTAVSAPRAAASTYRISTRRRSA